MAQSRSNASKSSSNKNQAQVSQWSSISQKYLIYLFFLSIFCSTACLWQFESGQDYTLRYQANINVIILDLYIYFL